MIFSAREAQAVLTALRYIQEHTSQAQRREMYKGQGISLEPLSDTEIDQLRDAVRFEEGGTK